MQLQIADQELTISVDNCRPVGGGYIINSSVLIVELPSAPRKFFRHGWQSWTYSAWVDPNQPMLPIAASEVRAKDEDMPYALSDHPVSAWVGAVEFNDGNFLLLGALDLSGRVKIQGNRLHGFYEDGHQGKWFIAGGSEKLVFDAYVGELAKIHGQVTKKPPRVWCSWYSLYNTVNEPVMDKVLDSLGKLPFDVVQIDDGWQISLGDWNPNRKFPSGMAALAGRIHATGRKAGLWLSPFVVPRRSQFAREHPDWILRSEGGTPVYAGVGWSGELVALDSAHPGVLDWLALTTRRAINWGFEYLKLDFLYAAALPGQHAGGTARETAFRQALQVIRNAAGADAYLLACGSPVLPVLGICDGLRIGPDVAPFWLSKPLSVWINNPSNPGTQNGIRTCLHRLWLKDLIHIDPDVLYFRSRHNHLKKDQRQYLQDLVSITGFKATSDLPFWLKAEESRNLYSFLEHSAFDQAAWSLSI